MEPSETDRNLFRDRLKEAIKDAGTSAKALEETLGLTKGTFTKVYAGKKELDAETLTAAAKELGADAAALVADTAFAALIAPAPAPEPDPSEQDTEIDSQDRAATPASPPASKPPRATPPPAPEAEPAPWPAKKPAAREEPPEEPPAGFFANLMKTIRGFFG